jgi:ubiquitin C-terminal hydrolase
VRGLKKCRFYSIRGYQQQDAHEFMHYLLDRVHNELLLTKMAYNGKNTIVTGIFGGILESQVCSQNLYFRLKFSMLKFLRFMLSETSNKSVSVNILPKGAN